MRKLKKTFSLTLALALSLSLAVPAFADSAKSYSANGYTDPAAENVEFSVAPIGVATIRWEVPGEGTTGPEYTAYVFDQDCVVTRKDGLPLTDFILEDGADRYWVNIGNKDFPYADVDVAGISADFEHYWLFQFGTKDSDDKDDWSPYMMSKKGLDSLSIKYDDAPSYVAVVEYRTLSAQPTTPSEPQQPVTPDAPGSYTVKKGDSWSSICTNFYGTNAQRYELIKANKNAALKEGTVITLPEKLGKAILLPAPAAAEGEKLYTVKAGDTLGKIAAAEYGRAGEYQAIFQRNADRLKNANTIYEGQVIVLPARK
ncbi:LysM peptidoglycan-binding domain-containing protein [Oscillospiraceae bacterium 44-34]